ncbi:hypothetical protein [Methylorubrum sp. SL192]|uniref:hypothetical protein n=1 Tax=Methylorubrum sp. SL192 TaxID=2995167 RepID=UPI0022727D97|nr:hypothetical protein [Methylorubrum sp. SL192]MCY1640698.1 hypothetical protein [Methylorubrum sp. SL192]
MSSNGKFIQYFGYGTTGANTLDTLYTAYNSADRSALATLNTQAQAAAAAAGLLAALNPGAAMSAGLFAMNVQTTKAIRDFKADGNYLALASSVAAVIGNGLVVASAGASFLQIKPAAIALGWTGAIVDIAAIVLNDPNRATQFAQSVIDVAGSVGSSSLYHLGSFLSNAATVLNKAISHQPLESDLNNLDQYPFTPIAHGFGVQEISVKSNIPGQSPTVEWSDSNGSKKVFVSGQHISTSVNNAEFTFAADTSANIFTQGSTIYLQHDSNSYLGLFSEQSSSVVHGIFGSTSMNLGGVGSSATVYGHHGAGGYVGLIESNQKLVLGNWGFSVATAPNVKNLEVRGDQANITFAANTSGNIHGQGTNVYLQADSNSYAGFFGTGTVSGVRGSTSINLGGDGTRATVYGEHGVGGYVGLVGNNQSLTLGNWGFSIATGYGLKNLEVIGDHANVTFAHDTTGNVHGQGTNLHLHGDSNTNAGFFGSGTISGVNGSTRLNLGGNGTTATVYGGGYVGLIDHNQSLTLADAGSSVGTASNLSGLTIYANNSTFHFANSVSAHVVGKGNSISVGNSSNVSVTGSSNNVNVHGIGSSISIGGNGQFAATEEVNFLHFAYSGNFHQNADSRVEVTGNHLNISADVNTTTYIFGDGNNTTLTDNNTVNYSGYGNTFNGFMSYGGWDGGYNTYSGGLWSTSNHYNVPPNDGFQSLTFYDNNWNITYYDPIVLSLDRKPLSTVSVEESAAFFDVHNEGNYIQTGWGSPGSGYLVDTTNGRDYVHSNRDIIHSFAQLSSYDSNADGVLDAKDSAWNNLEIWVDTNGDASFVNDSFFSFEEIGIQSIDLSTTSSWRYNNGNIISFEGNFTWDDGSMGDIAQVEFQYLPDAETIKKIFAAPEIDINQFIEGMNPNNASDYSNGDKVDFSTMRVFASSNRDGYLVDNYLENFIINENTLLV